MPHEPGHTFEDALLEGVLDSASPYFVVTLPQGVFLIDKKTGKPVTIDKNTGEPTTTVEPLIPSERLKPTDHFTIQTDPNTGRTWLVNTTTGEKEFISRLAPGSIEPLKTIDLPDGSQRVVYQFGNDIQVFTIPAGKEPFELGKIQTRDGINFIEVAPGQFQILPTQYQPGVIEQSGRLFIRQPDGSLQPLRKEYEAGLKTIGGQQFIQQVDGSLTLIPKEYEAKIVTQNGRDFIRQPDGSLTPLSEQFKAGVVSQGGREFLQQPSGQLSELAPRTPDAVMNQIISEAIINGDMDKALAFRDFLDRPTDQEALAYAFQFARSPADQLVVSALARGDQVVEQRPSTPTRIGPQPDFLINAFNKFQSRMGAGRAPTGEEAQFYLDFPRKRDEQRLEQERLRTEATNSAAQVALEKATQSGLTTLQQFLAQFGQQLMAGAKPAGAKPNLQTPTEEQARNTTSGGLSSQGYAVPVLSPAAKAAQARQTQGQVSESMLSPYQIEGINKFYESLQEPVKMAEGGIVFGPTNTILGESGPEAVIPLNQMKEENLPIDVRFLQQGRPIPPSRGNLFRSAGLTVPSAQALQNITPESLMFFRDLGALAGIPQQSFEQELRLGSPAGGRARSPLFLPFMFRR